VIGCLRAARCTLLSDVLHPIQDTAPTWSCLGDVATDGPNILLILSDDHSVPHVGCYGGRNCLRFDITPNLDAFAKEGMRFDRAWN